MEQLPVFAGNFNSKMISFHIKTKRSIFCSILLLVDVVAENDETLFNSQQVNLSLKSAKNTKSGCPKGSVFTSEHI